VRTQPQPFVHEEKLRMKVGPHLLAVLAFGAGSTNVAVARHHHGHHAGVGTAASQSGTNSPGVAKSPTATGGQQGSGPEGAVPDHVNADAADKGTADKSGLQSKTPPSVAASPDDARGIHRTVVPGGGIPQAGLGAEIDTRVTVHQGRDTLKISRSLKDINVTLLKKTKTTVAPGTGLKIENIHNHHLGSPVGSDGGVHRNAIGVAVDKTAKPGTTIGAATPTTIAVAAPPGAAIMHDPNTKAVGANVPMNNASTGAPPAITLPAPPPRQSSRQTVRAAMESARFDRDPAMAGSAARRKSPAGSSAATVSGRNTPDRPATNPTGCRQCGPCRKPTYQQQEGIMRRNFAISAAIAILCAGSLASIEAQAGAITTQATATSRHVAALHPRHHTRHATQPGSDITSFSSSSAPNVGVNHPPKK
jgi:hypothetical protein